MPRPGLTARELGTIWTGVQEGAPEDHVWQQLSSRDPKPVRAAYRVFRYLRGRHLDGSPVLVIRPTDGDEPGDRFRGDWTVKEFVTEARVQGYHLKEPGLLRLFALHNQLTLASHGALPGVVNGMPVPARPVAGRPTGHGGNLLRARDHVVSTLSVRLPRQLVTTFVQDLGRTSGQPGIDVEEWPDLTLEQFQMHARREPVTGEIERWHHDNRAYEASIRSLIESLDQEAGERTGLVRPYSTAGNDSVDPTGPATLQRWFIWSLLENGLDFADGVVPLTWRSQVEPFGGADSTVYKLSAEPVGKSMQVAAVGPHDVMREVASTQQKMRDELCHSGEMERVQAAYSTLVEEAQNLRHQLQDLTMERLLEHRCWGCPAAIRK